MKRFFCLLFCVWGAFAPDQSPAQSPKILATPQTIQKPDFTISNGNPATSGLIAFDPDGRLLAVASNNIVQVYEVHGSDRPKLTRTLANPSPIQAICFCNPSHRLIALLTDGTLRTWNVVSTRNGPTYFKPGPHTISVFSPHPNVSLLAAGTGNRVMVWDYQSGKLLGTFETNDSSVSTLAFTPDGRLLVIGTIKGVVRVLDVVTREVTERVDLDSPIHALAASAGPIVVGYSDGTVARVNSADRSSIQEVEAHKQAVSAVAFSPGGGWFASGSVDGTVKVWNTETLKPICTLEGNTAKVLAILFSPDGRELISSGADGTIIGWRLPYE